MKLKFCGGAKNVSGANYLFQTEKTSFLFDGGMFQGTKEMEEKNRRPFAYDPKKIDFVIISHSHIDHIGRLPSLVKEGFAGKIYATPPTIDFTRLLLEDSQRLLEEKAAKAGVLSLIGPQDIDSMMDHFEPVEYGQEVKASSDVRFTFHEAGHILGSCITKIFIQDKDREKIVVCSGDLGNYPVPILRAPALIDKADYVLIESAYGDRNHAEEAKNGKDMLEDVVEETISRGGVLMIPSFAMERTQQLLYQLNELIENRRIPRVPIFIDSPLAIKITRVYKKYENYFNRGADNLIQSGDDIFHFPGLKFTESTEDSKKINDVPPPKIIIAGAGMSQGGRIVHHEKRYLSDPKNTLLIVSYQAQGTPGRKLVEGERKVRFFDEEIEVKAQVIKNDSYSAHADQTGLLGWLSFFQKPIQRVFVVQGEETAARALAVKIRDEMGIDSDVPDPGEEVIL